MIDLENKRKRIEMLVKLALLPVVGFFLAPFVFIAIKGLIGAVIAAAIGIFVINLAPWFAMKVANWRLKAIKHEASKNPIETLQNEYKHRMECLNTAEERLKVSVGRLSTFKEQLNGFKQKYPSEAPKFDQQYSDMRRLLDHQKQKYVFAQGELRRFNDEIDKAKAIWDMSQAAAEMNKALGVDIESFYSKISVETALLSVQDSMSTAFSELEVSLLEEKPEVKQLPQPQPAVVISTPIQERIPVR